MLNEIKTQIHQSIEELFALAATDKLAGDEEGYADRLSKIITIAGILGIKTRLTVYELDLKDEE